MNKKTIAYSLLGSIGFAFLVALFSDAMSYELKDAKDAMYTLAGIGIFGFSIWLSVVTIKEN